MRRGALLRCAVATALLALLSLAGAGSCPTAFYAPGELPRIHAIDLNVSIAGFQAMVAHQQDRDYPEIDATVTVNGARYPSAKVKPHGGNPQRAGGDCAPGYVYGKRAEGPWAANGGKACKIGMRLKFSKHHPFSWDADEGGAEGLFRFPANQRWCNKVTKLLLRNEYEDPALMVRNKLTQDIFKHAGVARRRASSTRRCR